MGRWLLGALWASTQPEENCGLHGSPAPTYSHCEGGSRAKQPLLILALGVHQFHIPNKRELPPPTTYPSVHLSPLRPLAPAWHSHDTFQDLHQPW